MGYESDIFISYAHVDNESLDRDHEGWITRLHKALEIRVTQFLGKNLKVWRDPKLQGNDVFPDTLVDQLPQAATLVSVFSPRYIESEWCTRELREFWDAAERQSRAVVDNKSRVFKVIKTPVPVEQHPPIVQEQIGYEFFTRDPVSGRVRELDKIFGAEAEQEFWVRLDDLAHDVADLLKKLVEGPSRTDAQGSADRPTVFLADVTADVREQHDAVKRELQRAGYAVLPDQALPLNGPRLETFLREQLAGCDLSVHIVGRSYGIVPEDSTESLAVIQNEVAAARGAEDDFTRLVWIPPDLEVEDERQREVIERLGREPGLRHGGDLLQTPFEGLKTVLFERLHQLEQPKKAETPESEDPDELTRVYLVCDQRDLETIGPLHDLLFDQGLEVMLPAFEGDASEIREANQEKLRSCDGVLVYYGAGNDAWLERKLSEVKKSAGYGRTEPIRSTAVCIAGPATPQKQLYRTRQAEVIRAGDAITIDALSPFLSRLQSDADGAEG